MKMIFYFHANKTHLPRKVLPLNSFWKWGVWNSEMDLWLRTPTWRQLGVKNLLIMLKGYFRRKRWSVISPLMLYALKLIRMFCSFCVEILQRGILSVPCHYSGLGRRQWTSEASSAITRGKNPKSSDPSASIRMLSLSSLVYTCPTSFLRIHHWFIFHQPLGIRSFERKENRSVRYMTISRQCRVNQ